MTKAQARLAGQLRAAKLIIEQTACDIGNASPSQHNHYLVELTDRIYQDIEKLRDKIEQHLDEVD